MEKVRSLRLKRKTNSAATSHDAKKIKTCPSEKSDKPIVKVQPIVLSSDSDEECQHLKIPHKQRNEELNGDLSTVKNSGSIRPEDSSLCKLKQLMYKLTSRECVDPSAFVPFPPHPQELEENGALNSKAKATDLNWRLQTKLDSLISSELPPFPKSCEKCRRMCKGLKSLCDTTTSGLIEDRNDGNTSIHRKHEERNSVDVSACQKLKGRHDISVANHQEVFQSNFLNRSGSSNLNENLNDYKSSHVTTGAKNLTNSAQIDINVTTSPCSNEGSSDDHSSRFRPSLSSAKAAEPSIISRPEVRHTANFENSHLMRDRNSNYYSLQSRNSQIFAQPERCSNSEKPNANSGENDLYSGKHNSKSGNSKLELENSISNSIKQNSNKAKLCVGLGKQSAENHRLNVRKSDDDARNVDSDFVGKPSASDVSWHQTVTSAIHDKVSKSASERSIVFDHNGHSNEAQRNASSSSKAQISNKRVDQVSDNQVKKKASGNKREKVGAGNQIQEDGAGNQRQEAGAGNQRQEASAGKHEPVLQSCPMCQMEFSEGTTQLDIDSHLATCLSSADDDFVW